MSSGCGNSRRACARSRGAAAIDLIIRAERRHRADARMPPPPRRTETKTRSFRFSSSSYRARSLYERIASYSLFVLFVLFVFVFASSRGRKKPLQRHLLACARPSSLDRACADGGHASTTRARVRDAIVSPRVAPVVVVVGVVGVRRRPVCASIRVHDRRARARRRQGARGRGHDRGDVRRSRGRASSRSRTRRG